MAQGSRTRCGVKEPTDDELARRRLFLLSEAGQKGGDGLVTVRVCVHVVSRSIKSEEADDAEIESQLAVLNRDFQGRSNGAAADAGIAFHLEKTVAVSVSADTDLFSERGVRLASAHQPNCLNIWVCGFEKNLGAGTYPWQKDIDDGLTVHRSAFGTTGSAGGKFRGGRTTTHEIGHWLGLLHVEDDELGDTFAPMPADFMSTKSTDTDMKLFTNQQVAVMRAYLFEKRADTIKP